MQTDCVWLNLGKFCSDIFFLNWVININWENNIECSTLIKDDFCLVFLKIPYNCVGFTQSFFFYNCFSLIYLVEQLLVAHFIYKALKQWLISLNRSLLNRNTNLKPLSPRYYSMFLFLPSLLDTPMLTSVPSITKTLQEFLASRNTKPSIKAFSSGLYLWLQVSVGFLPLICCLNCPECYFYLNSGTASCWSMQFTLYWHWDSW